MSAEDQDEKGRKISELERKLATSRRHAAALAQCVARLRRLNRALNAEVVRLRARAPASGSAQRRPLPATRDSITHKFEVAGHAGYVTVGLYPDGRPGEIFVVMGKEGATLRGFCDAWARAVSLLLQYGAPLEDIVRKFAGFSFEPAGFSSEPRLGHARSIIDYLVRWLALRFGVHVEEVAQAELPLAQLAPGHAPPLPGIPEGPAGVVTSGPPCPECGTLTVRAGSCHACPNCGETTGCT